MRWRQLLFVALIGLPWLVAAFVPPAPVAAADEPKPIKLAVLVIFDQMRGDYLARWDALFGDDGFRRLEKDGAWFQNAHYPYATTVTGAGHASLATGCSPAKHGIVANEWYDRDLGDAVYCATSPTRKRVPPADPDAADEDPKGKKKKIEGGTPERLLVPSFADVYKEAVGDRGKVTALSFKDRGAVFTGGRKADACFWLESETGQAVTSTFYRDKLPAWVEEFNKGKPADHWFGKDWTRLRADLDYEKYSGPDDAPGEDKGFGQGVTFPHPMDGGLKAPGRKYYEAVYDSPFGNELLLELTEKAIAAEKLGTHEAPDLLCVSFSCTDPPGHTWGPDSQEVLDVTLRADRIVAGLMAYLDEHVGKGRYVLVLSSDHGICPLPEASVKQGKDKDARRILPSLLQSQAEDHLDKTFAKKDERTPRIIEAMVDENIYLNRAWLKDHDLDSGRVEEDLAKWLAEQPGVLKGYTRTELMKEIPKDDEIGRRVRQSFHPDRSGDVVVVTKPYSFLSPRLAGTMHGTPYPYDTHVPLMVFGPGVRPGAYRDAVIPQAVVPILAHALGVKPPASAEVGVPEKLFVEP